MILAKKTLKWQLLYRKKNPHLRENKQACILYSTKIEPLLLLLKRIMVHYAFVRRNIFLKIGEQICSGFCQICYFNGLC